MAAIAIPTLDARNASAPANRLQQGWVQYLSASDSWVYYWKENGRRHARTIGHSAMLPDKAAAWAAAEPLRQAFLKRQQNTTSAATIEAKIQRDAERALQDETPEEVEVLFVQDERSVRRYRVAADAVLSIYLDRKDLMNGSGGIRAKRYDDWLPVPYQNASMSRATVSDFLADCQIAARSALTSPLHKALFRILYMEARCPVERAAKVFAGELDDMHVALGREFVRRGISPTYEYFREFKSKPKQIR